jgi:hypothetical protein
MEYFNYLGSMITTNARCTHEIESRIVMAKTASTKESSFHQQIALKFKEEISKVLHLEHSTVLC